MQRRVFTVACEDFGLTISLKQTKVMAQDVDAPPYNYQHPRVCTRSCSRVRLPGLNDHGPLP